VLGVCSRNFLGDIVLSRFFAIDSAGIAAPPSDALRRSKIRKGFEGGATRLATCFALGVSVASHPLFAATPVPPNLGSGLDTIYQSHLEREGRLPQTAQSPAVAEAANDYLANAFQDEAGRIRVMVHLNGTQPLNIVVALLQRSGKFVVAGQSDKYRAGVIDGWVQVADLATIAKTRGVQSVVLSMQPVADVGNVTQQGFVQHRVDQVTSANGTGITIGALSDSYNALPAASTLPRAPADVLSGDLPGATNPLGNTQDVVVIQELAGTGTDEGRAMLQLIHDIAPKARLGFATSGNSQLQFADNIRSLAGLPGAPRAVPGFKADIIVDDIIYLTEPMFSDGIVAQAVNDVTAAGKHYFSSAGNRPSSQGYAGNFNQVGPAGLPTAGSNINLAGVDPTLYSGGFHNFRSDGGQDIAQTIRRTTGTGSSNARLVMQWDDPFDKVTPGTQVFNVAANFTGTPAGLDFFVPLNANVPTRIVAAQAGSTFDAIVTITDPSGNVIVNAQDTVEDETVFFTPTQTGSYKVTIEAFNSTTGAFTLSVFANSFLGVTTEYNLLFFRSDTGAFVSAVRSNALSANQPVAVATTIPFPSGLNTLQLVIARSGGSTANRLRYVFFAGSSTVRPDEYTSYQYPVTYGHNSAANGHGVAAFSAFRPYIPEDFSSPGPVTILFDADGNRLPAPQIRQQPVIAAMDGANNTFFGNDSQGDADTFPNFFGTSAAAPNAAAVAALVLQSKGGPGSLTVAQMKAILTGSTMPNDLDPQRSRAAVNLSGTSTGTLTITLDADYTNSSAATASLPLIDPNVFKVSYAGTGSVASITLNGANGNTTGGNNPSGGTPLPGMVFDTRAIASAGLPVTFGTLNGLTAADITAVPGATAPSPAVAGQSFALALSFAPGSFTTGESFGFNVDRDEHIVFAIGAFTPQIGNSADLFGANVSIPEATLNPGGVTVTVTMTDGTTATGTFTNDIGTGYSPLTGFGFVNAQAAVAFATVPPTVPDSAIITNATAGNAQIAVAFDAPVATGGSPVIDYTVTCGTVSQVGTASPILVTGLTNGVTYTCTVVARNTTGTSPRSAPSNAVTPAATSTTTTLTGPASSNFGQSVTFTAEVNGIASPTGTVAFADGASTIAGCSAVALTATGAACTTSALPLGARSITATYSGDANNTTSTSNALPHTVNQVFYALTVNKAGLGRGSVASAPTGIACGTDCTENYAAGTSVTLIALPETGSVFAGWVSGTGSVICSGIGSCVVTVSEASSVTASFLPLVTFNVVIEGIQEQPRRATPAVGGGTVVVDTVANTLTYDITYTNLAGTFTVAHFHGPAAREANAVVKIDITANPNSGTVTYNEADEADILAGRWYYNLHTTVFTGGELRGQLDNLGAACGLDIDVDSQVTATSDGQLVLRYLLGTRGASLVSGLLNPPSSTRVDVADIETVIRRMVENKQLDFDGNGVVDARTDGLLLLRALLGFSETSATDGALGTGTLLRGDWTAIRSYVVDNCKVDLP
jgi:CHRD domain/Bacterial Ig-like domain (group 3)/Divergent InlB B-repeat domain